MTVPPTISIEETALATGFGRSAIYEAARRGELPIIQLGRRKRVVTAILAARLGVTPRELADYVALHHSAPHGEEIPLTAEVISRRAT